MDTKCILHCCEGKVSSKLYNITDLKWHTSIISSRQWRNLAFITVNHLSECYARFAIHVEQAERLQKQKQKTLARSRKFPQERRLQVQEASMSCLLFVLSTDKRSGKGAKKQGSGLQKNLFRFVGLVLYYLNGS